MKSSSWFLRKYTVQKSKLKFFFLLLLLLPELSFASSNVPIDDPVYRDIDKLVGAGFIKDAIYGQRPWSRKEIARMIASAKKNEKENALLLTPNGSDVELTIMIQDILEKLTHDYREELIENGTLLDGGESKLFNIKPLEQVRLDYTFLDSPARAVPPNNGLGGIDAVINPMVAYQEGRHIVDGNTLGFETTHRGQFSKYFSLYARPRFELTGPRGAETKANFYAQQLYGNFSYKKLSIEVGRDSLIWGQGENGGILLTNNARALDQIKISSDAPFFFPGFLKYLGPSKATLFVANLGPDRTSFPYAFLTGFKMSVKPTSFLELGASQTVMMGGNGAQAGSFWDYMGEFFAVRPNIGFTPSDVGLDNGVDLSDRLMGADFRLTIPQFNNTQIYGEAFTEACCGVFKTLYGYYGGFYFPIFLSNSLDLRLEYSHLPGILYRHGGQWTDGKTLNHHLLGNFGGPDSDIALAKIRKIYSEHWYHQLYFYYETYKGNNYSGTDGTINSVYASTILPKEYRYRITNQLTYQADHWGFEGLMGLERITHFNFIDGNNKTNLLLGMQFTFRP